MFFLFSSKRMLTLFIKNLFETCMDLHFTYLEIKPLFIFILDLASKIDQTVDYLCKIKWSGEIEFLPPFGCNAYILK